MCDANWVLKAAFEGFLRDFKTSPEEAIADAFGNISIDEDDLSDEYDFMDEDEDAQQRRVQEKARRKLPQFKYRNMLQRVADRELSEVQIDLDDLASVRTPPWAAAYRSRAVC